MTNAGYGNHDAPLPGSANPPEAATGKRPLEQASSKKPGAGAADRDSPNLTDRRDATPGAGALPAGGQGDEVDPGAG